MELEMHFRPAEPWRIMKVSNASDQRAIDDAVRDAIRAGFVLEYAVTEEGREVEIDTSTVSLEGRRVQFAMMGEADPRRIGVVETDDAGHCVLVRWDEAASAFSRREWRSRSALRVLDE